MAEPLCNPVISAAGAEQPPCLACASPPNAQEGVHGDTSASLTASSSNPQVSPRRSSSVRCPACSSNGASTAQQTPPTRCKSAGKSKTTANSKPPWNIGTRVDTSSNKLYATIQNVIATSPGAGRSSRCSSPVMATTTHPNRGVDIMFALNDPQCMSKALVGNDDTNYSGNKSISSSACACCQQVIHTNEAACEAANTQQQCFTPLEVPQHPTTMTAVDASADRSGSTTSQGRAVPSAALAGPNGEDDEEQEQSSSVDGTCPAIPVGNNKGPARVANVRLYSPQNLKAKDLMQRAQPSRSAATTKPSASEPSSNVSPVTQQQQPDRVQASMASTRQLAASLKSTQRVQALRSSAGRSSPQHPRRSAVDAMLQKQFDLQAQFERKVQKWKGNPAVVGSKTPAGASTDDTRQLSSVAGQQQEDMCDAGATSATAAGLLQPVHTTTEGADKGPSKAAGVAAELVCDGSDASTECCFNSPKSAERSAYNQHPARLQGEVCYTHAVPVSTTADLTAPAPTSPVAKQQLPLATVSMTAEVAGRQEQQRMLAVPWSPPPVEAVIWSDEAVQQEPCHDDYSGSQQRQLNSVDLSLQEPQLRPEASAELKQTLQKLLVSDSDESEETWLVAAHQPEQHHLQQLCQDCQHPMPVSYAAGKFSMTQEHSDPEILLEPLQQQCPSLPLVQLQHQQEPEQLPQSRACPRSVNVHVAEEPCDGMPAVDCTAYCSTCSLENQQPTSTAEGEDEQTHCSVLGPCSSLTQNLVNAAVDHAGALVQSMETVLAGTASCKETEERTLRPSLDAADSGAAGSVLLLEEKPDELLAVSLQHAQQHAVQECSSSRMTDDWSACSTVDRPHVHVKHTVAQTGHCISISSDHEQQLWQQLYAQGGMPDAGALPAVPSDPPAATAVPIASSIHRHDDALDRALRNATSSSQQPVNCSNIARNKPSEEEDVVPAAAVTTAVAAAVGSDEAVARQPSTSSDINTGHKTGAAGLSYSQVEETSVQFSASAPARLAAAAAASVDMEQHPRVDHRPSDAPAASAVSMKAAGHVSCDAGTAPTSSLVVLGPLQLLLQQLQLQHAVDHEQAGCQSEQAASLCNYSPSLNGSMRPAVAAPAFPAVNRSSVADSVLDTLADVEFTWNALYDTQGPGGKQCNRLDSSPLLESLVGVCTESRKPIHGHDRADKSADVVSPGSAASVLSDAVIRLETESAVSADDWSSEGLTPMKLSSTMVCPADHKESEAAHLSSRVPPEKTPVVDDSVEEDSKAVAAAAAVIGVDSGSVGLPAGSAVHKQLMDAATAACSIDNALLLSGMNHTIALLLDMKHQLEEDVAALKESLSSLKQHQVTPHVQHAPAGSQYAMSTAGGQEASIMFMDGTEHTTAAAAGVGTAVKHHLMVRSVQCPAVGRMSCSTRPLSSRVLHQMYPAPADGVHSDHNSVADRNCVASGVAAGGTGSATVCLVQSALSAPISELEVVLGGY